MSLNEQIQQLNAAVIKATEMINRLNEEKQEEYERGYAKGYSDGQDQCVEPTHKHVGNALDVRCDDAISREAVIEWLKAKDIIKLSSQEERARQELNELPSVTQKSGKWISRPHIYGVTFCSECGYELKINNTNHCPNCGAKMESEE